ncbi:hypothetical protein B0T18DRAFT_417240, partial [Schizothecium vesticola]
MSVLTTTMTVSVTTTEKPSVIQSETKAATTSSKRPDSPLHLIGPWPDDAAFLPHATARPGTKISSNVSYPHGLPPKSPLPLDPLGLDSLPTCYGPGPSILLFCLGVASALQLFRVVYPPFTRRTITTPSGSYRLDMQSFLPVSMTQQINNPEKGSPRACPGLLRKILELKQLARHLPQALAITGLNMASLDLLLHLRTLDKTYQADPHPPSWIPAAGHVGPPLVFIAWGVLFAIIRALTSLTRLLIHRPPEEAQHTARLQAYFRPQLLINTVSLFLPALALAAFLSRLWFWRAAGDTNKYRPGMYPVDFIPALYWDGLGEVVHATLLFGFSLVGASSVLALVLASAVVYGRRSAVVWRAGKVLCWGYLGAMLLAFAGMALCTVLVGAGKLSNELTGRFGGGEASLLKWIEWTIWAMLWLASPALVHVYGMFTVVVVIPLVSLWYVLKGWVFGATDVDRSCFFVPCVTVSGEVSSLRNGSWWEWLMAALGWTLMGYHVWAVVKERKS